LEMLCKIKTKRTINNHNKINKEENSKINKF
jgi:hypothetical protein